MSAIEAAPLITMKAMETSKIVYKGKQDGQTIEDVNAFNAEQIAKLYRAIYAEIIKPE